MSHHIPSPPDGSNATLCLEPVASAAARLLLPQECAVGRLVKQDDDGSLWVLKPFGCASASADWQGLFAPLRQSGNPVSAVKGVGTLTLGANAANGNIVTLGTRTYPARTTVLQVETATVIAAAGSTTGNLAVTVTIGGVATVMSVPLDSGVQTTATLIATAIAFAMSNELAITTDWTVTHPTSTLVLTRKVAAANDTTLNIAITGGLGVTAVVSSVNTTAGVGLAANEFKIGASASASIDNLIAAITGGAGVGTGAGTLYGVGTVTHPLATAAVGAGDTMTATALTEGLAGNIASTATLANGSWGAETLETGVDGTAVDYIGQDCIVGSSTWYKALSKTPPVWVAH
jgi:hypothetical protein